MKKNFANTATPTTSKDWVVKSEKDRIEMISQELKKNILYKDFEVVKVPDIGQI